MLNQDILNQIQSYKHISASNLELPNPGEAIAFKLIGEEQNEFKVHIKRGKYSTTLSLTGIWDFGLKDKYSELIRIDYGDTALHREKCCDVIGPHLHVGKQVLSFPEINEYFEDIVDPDLVYNQDADIITAIRGFLLACGVDYNEVNNLEIR